ncbi:dihydrolipoyl dehydrogenase [Alkalihalobacillus sp. 1P02AB]|uniref:dihydrolipoyl dehydrogenase n=1 Tax=Alkalihalobacillus sp. 1P02AB TaxID=3132260 RepID=UPI0039A6C3AC
MVVGEIINEVDVLIIGGGPGGYTAAIRASQLGKRVTIVEKNDFGGVCLNKGCIPSKALISVARKYDDLQKCNEYGLEVEGAKVHFNKVQAWKNGIVEKLTSGVKGLLKGNQIETVVGEAYFISQDEVRIENGYNSDRLKFNHCIIATGSTPFELPGIPFRDRILSSTEALSLEEVPKELIVLGGGYIGIELGQTYASFGSKVTILEAQPSILTGFEPRAVKFVQQSLAKKDVDVKVSIQVEQVNQDGEKVHIQYKEKGTTYSISGDYLLVTAGRKPNVENLSLDMLKMKVSESGHIEVNEHCETSIKNIYAIGDVVRGPALAHKASYEGKVVAEVIAGQSAAVDYQAIPIVVFSDPEIASVGLTEETALKEGYNIKVGRFPFGANGRALSLNASNGLVTVIIEKETNLILGAQIVGKEASELIAVVGFAIEMGATSFDLMNTIHAHPTISETLVEATESAVELAIHTL